jgi:hypothetical protein
MTCGRPLSIIKKIIQIFYHIKWDPTLMGLTRLKPSQSYALYILVNLNRMSCPRKVVIINPIPKPIPPKPIQAWDREVWDLKYNLLK